MIVAASIHRLEREPLIIVGIVYLCLLASTVDIFARASHDNQVLAYCAARVTVSGISHLCASLEFILIRESWSRYDL